MKKKIIIATMLVSTLLLLMPSIPAIQQKTIEEGIKKDFKQKLKTFTFEDIVDLPISFLKLLFRLIVWFILYDIFTSALIFIFMLIILYSGGPVVP